MALPKKGSRVIIVDNIKYRWIGLVLKYDSPNEPAYVIIELYENAKQKIRAFFSWEKMNKEYKKVKKIFEKNGPEGQLSTSFFKTMNHSVAANVAAALEFNGALMAPSCACATSTQAIIMGWELIKAGL